MTEYEFRLVTEVASGDEGKGWMGNTILSYVVLGTWYDNDQDTSDSSYESNLDVTDEDIAREARKKVNERHIKVDIPIPPFEADYINLRSSPNDETADNIIGTIPNQTELDVILLNDTDLWVMTTYDNKNGYIKLRVNDIPVVKQIEKTKAISYYELLTSQPGDWETNYADYYVRNADDTFVHVEGVPDSGGGTVAPPWREHKYYRFIDNEQTNANITTGALVRVKQSAENYYNSDVRIPDRIKEKNWYVLCVTNSERVVIDASEDGQEHIESPVHIKDLELIKAPGSPTPATEVTDTSTEENEETNGG